MGKIVVNKHVDNKAQVSSESFVNKGEIVISNQVGGEGIYIVNKNNDPIFIGPSTGEGSGGGSGNSDANHVFLSSSEYETLISKGSVVVNGVTIIYDDNTYYAIYEDIE